MKYEILEDFEEIEEHEPKLFPEGEFIFKITEAYVFDEIDDDNIPKYRSLIIKAETEDGTEYSEKFRYGEYDDNGKVQPKKPRFNFTKRIIRDIYGETEPVAINRKTVKSLKGRFFRAEVTHNKADDGTTFANINANSVCEALGFDEPD